jgi:uncharacterized phiE125 gp8 family phage protein
MRTSPILRLISAPVNPCVTLAEAREQCRVDDGDTSQDGKLLLFIAAATARFDGEGGLLGRCLRAQTWELVASHFPGNPDGYFYNAHRGRIALPLPPTQSVLSITYLDTTETVQTFDPSLYRVIDGGDEGSYIVPKLGIAWPQTAFAIDAVRVRFTAGYGTTNVNEPPAGIVPELVRQAILLTVTNWFENRSDAVVGTNAMELPGGVADIVAPLRKIYNPEPV